MRLNASDIEFAVGKYLNPRVNVIVPNVFWGMGLRYEADLWCLSSAGYITEVEIKVSVSNIKAEKNKKSYAHNSKHVRRFFYAVPDYLADCEYLPVDCGLITVDQDFECKTIRPPKQNKNAVKLSEGQRMKLLHLGCMRIWGLKETLARHRREKQCRK